MMHKAWCSIEEVPYCFPRSSIKFQGHTEPKIADFDPNWAFPDCNFSFNSPMDLKWCTKLDVVWKRCPIVFQGHPSNFKVTRDKKSPISTRIESFRSVTAVWIHRWIWNDTQSLMYYGRGAFLFFEVIHQISRSHGLKIDDLDQIWARLLGQSQLSNPLDLLCLLRKSLQWAPHISAVRVRYGKLSGAYLFGTQHIKHYKVDEFLHFAQLIETPWLSPVIPVREEVFIPQSVLFHWCTCS